ncbi:MAG: hypothetical protein KOO60_04515 [Gemmatimonadales bacterium]|nr:hypothetical protein [Gemmatimonadales bacterium]
MKTLMTSIMMALLVCLLAVGAMAQSEDAPQTKPIVEDDFPDYGSNGASVRTHTIQRSETTNMYQGTNGSDDSDGIDKAFTDEDGDGFDDLDKSSTNPSNGLSNRIEHQNQGVSGPHGNLSGDSEDLTKVFGDGDEVTGELAGNSLVHGQSDAQPREGDSLTNEGENTFGDPFGMDPDSADAVTARERKAHK